MKQNDSFEHYIYFILYVTKVLSDSHKHTTYLTKEQKNENG